MKKKKKVLLFSILGVLLIGIAISFAYWQIILQQENPNVVTTECFQINFTDGEGISINDAHPVSDEEGLTSTPYDFTITNICNSSASYQINLETLSVSGKQLPEKYLKANLMEETTSKITAKLLSNIEVEPTIEGALKSYQLLKGVLNPNEEKTFHLRLWMHSEVTVFDTDSMNATYTGKVSVITSYYQLPTIVDTIKDIPLVTEGNGLYEISHEDAEITYTSDETAINNLKQTEYRYAGPNPDNYVRFNNELWRIIGLVNTPEGQRIKIRRNENIGEHSWDSSELLINEGYGINEWSQSKMMILLNHGPYYNRTSGTCYNEYNNSTKDCDFSSTGLLKESKNMIDTITWNTGSSGTLSYKSINTNMSYSLERSNNTGKICISGLSCNDSVERTTNWKGQVGLIYPSDYGYATSGGSTATRETCLNKELRNWYNSTVSDCKNNDWLYDNYQWILNPQASSNDAYGALSVSTDGAMYGNLARNSYAVFPTLYLKSNIKLVSGNGTEDSPYELSA